MLGLDWRDVEENKSFRRLPGAMDSAASYIGPILEFPSAAQGTAC